MLPYQPVPVRMAQAAPMAPPATVPALTPGQHQAAVVLGVAETAFGVIAAWMGVRAGLHERKTVFKTLGWVTAIGGGLFGAVNLLGTLGTLARPQA